MEISSVSKTSGMKVVFCIKEKVKPFLMAMATPPTLLSGLSFLWKVKFFKAWLILGLALVSRRMMISYRGEIDCRWPFLWRKKLQFHWKIRRGFFCVLFEPLCCSLKG